MIANNMIGVCEALIYAKNNNIDLERMIGLLQGGAGGSFSLTALGPKMLKGDYEPGFYAEHLHKDLGIVQSESFKQKLLLPGSTQAYKLYGQVVKDGHG